MQLYLICFEHLIIWLDNIKGGKHCSFRGSGELKKIIKAKTSNIKKCIMLKSQSSIGFFSNFHKFANKIFLLHIVLFYG